MKRLILLVMLAGAFGGGYYLGHRPGSPDIFAHAGRMYRQAEQASRRFVAGIETEKAGCTPRAARLLLSDRSNSQVKD